MTISSPFFRIQRTGHTKICILALLCLAAPNITACDFVNSRLDPDFRKEVSPIQVKNSSINQKQMAKNISINEIRDMASASSVNNDFTVNPIALNDKSNDLNSEQAHLFSAPIQDTEQRFDRIEKNVQLISDTLAKMSPKITKLMGIESELDNLTYQLEDLISKGKMDEFVTPSQQKAQPIRKRQTINVADNNSNEGNLISKMRIGDHPGKARIVFETFKQLDYEVLIDNSENILTIEFPKGKLPPIASSLARSSDLIKSITQSKNGEGALIVFELSRNTQKLKNFRISPDKELSRHRIVIDLKR